jgi:hypothetical protein
VHPQKRWQRVRGVDHAEGTGELWADVVHGVDDEIMAGDKVAGVDEGVRQALEAAATVADGEIALL